MTASFQSKDDVNNYLRLFSTNQFRKASEYWAPGIEVNLGGKTRIKSREENVKFFTKQRQVMNEDVAAQSITLEEGSCAIQAIVTFTALQDFPEGYFGMPSVKSGQKIRSRYLILYALDQKKQARSIEASRLSDPVVSDE